MTGVQTCALPISPDWTSVNKLADPALHGVLNHARLKGYTPPEIGFELTTVAGQVIAELELAWPHRKFGICIGEPIEHAGWHILGLKQALDFFARRS